MTKEEILAAINNHSGDINRILNGVITTVDSVVRGYIDPAQETNMIDGVKSSIDTVKNQADEIADLLDQWPGE